MDILHGRWRQLKVLTKLAKVIHVTPDNDLALGLRRRRLLHLLLLLLGRSSGCGDVRRRQTDVVRRHDHLGLNLLRLLLLLLLVVGHYRRWRHVCGMVWMSYVHRRFAHLATGATHLLGTERWRRFGIVWRRTRILPYGALRQRLSVTIYIHATTVGHFPTAAATSIAVHLVHILVTIYNRRLAMLRRRLLMGRLLMLNVTTVR